MRETIWQRLRRRGDEQGSSVAGGNGSSGAPANEGDSLGDTGGRGAVDPSDGAGPTADSPTAGARPGLRPPQSNVDIDLTGGERPPNADRQAAYADWAERMRTKRESKVRSVRDEETTGRRVNYWSEDALFQESRRLEDEPGRAVRTRRELLEVLGLGGEATETEVQRQYRRLAKQHHPDRYHDADDATREEHAEQMQRISAAYRALQRA